MSAYPPPTNVQSSPENIPNYLAWSIISTVISTCLCCPLGLIGIVAIVFSTQVNSKLLAGDIVGARIASDNAKIWCWVTTAVAIIGLILNIIMVATGALGEYMQAVQ
jgi:hypothetical protein